MKKAAVWAVTAVLLLALACGAATAEGGRFVTVEEWLNAKGECGECMLLLKIQTVLNPVLAIGADETGAIPLYAGGEEGLALEFANDEQFLEGYWIVIANPRYNEFEGSVEMASWTLLRLMPDIPAAE